MGPSDTNDIYDLIWSNVDKCYIAFPRNHGDGIFQFPGLFGASSLAGKNAIGLQELKPVVDKMIEKVNGDYYEFINNL